MIDPIQQILIHKPTIGNIPEAGEGVRATQGETRRTTNFTVGDSSLDDLSATPGSPGWARKMEALQKDARLRGETQPELILPDGAVATAPPEQEPLPILVPAGPKRVAVYYGRSKPDLESTYNVAIEAAPDWDTDFMFRGLDGDSVGLLLDMAKALGVKVSDKTGEF